MRLLQPHRFFAGRAVVPVVPPKLRADGLQLPCDTQSYSKHMEALETMNCSSYLNCNNWDYSDHPERHSVLPERCYEVYKEIRDNKLSILDLLANSRPTHKRIFEFAAPSGCQYMAGYYRGEDFPCLVNYQVGIESDSSVGYAPSIVLEAMEVFGAIGIDSIIALDSVIQNPNIPMDYKLIKAVTSSCDIFEYFLRIHPYANGNGHLSRMLLWATLKRYDFEPRGLTIDTRPMSPYTSLIRLYRQGDKNPLLKKILSFIISGDAIDKINHRN